MKGNIATGVKGQVNLLLGSGHEAPPTSSSSSPGHTVDRTCDEKGAVRPWAPFPPAHGVPGLPERLDAVGGTAAGETHAMWGRSPPAEGDKYTSVSKTDFTPALLLPRRMAGLVVPSIRGLARLQVPSTRERGRPSGAVGQPGTLHQPWKLLPLKRPLVIVG
ncbi:hypothetical protein P7K49_013207 [Saguinus oedipus]|uniref:Uncharacterized protein n=1 Tax=Saguinus oedipus TaxID=9490 RepID=A0ABQ9VFL9_SAGOE|nr:hypothetical protein P7K49_013207 [Saguinus oedipus]